MAHPATTRRATTWTPPGARAAEVVRRLELVPGSEDVELRFTVPQRHRRSVLTALGGDPVGVLIRQVAFVDTPDLLLRRHGTSVRVRRSQHQSPDLTVVVRPVDLEALRPDLRAADGLQVGVEASDSTLVCSCSAVHALTGSRARAVLGGRLGVDEVLTDTQRALIAHTLPGGLPDDLSVLGPVHVLRRRFVPPGYPRRLVLEQWFLPDGGRVLELSTRCEAAAVPDLVAETRRFLVRHGVDLDATADLRTPSALADLAVRLPARLPLGGPVPTQPPRVPAPRT